MTRVPCIIPHCGRTCAGGQGFTEFLCVNHWGRVPRKIRRVFFARKRRFAQAPTVRNMKLENRAWDRCKRAALDRIL